MANTRISELPEAPDLAGVVLAGVQSGANVKVPAILFGTSGGIVESVVAGDNITVDATDPANPIISATGGGNFVADIAALKALDTSSVADAYLTQSGRAGQFIFRAGDYSSQVTADSEEGVYIEADDTASTSGAWVRVFERLSAEFFGASAGATRAENVTALQAAVDFAQLYTGELFLPDTYLTDDTILVSSTIFLHGVSEYQSGISCNNGNAIDIIPSNVVAANNTWWGFNKFSAVSTGGSPSRGISYVSTNDEYMSNWTMERVNARGVDLGALFDSSGSTVGIFSCTIRRNWFQNGLKIVDGGDSITILENTVHGAGIGIHVDGLKTGARQLVIRNNNCTALSECVWLEDVVNPLIEGNWAETPSYVGSYTGTSGALVNLQNCDSARVFRNTLQPLDEVGSGFVGANYSIRVGGTSPTPIIDDNDIADGQTGHINIDGAGVTSAYIGWANKYAETAVITNTGTGTHIATVPPPRVSAANTWSAAQTFAASNTFTAAQTITDALSAVPQLIVQSSNADNLPGPMVQLDRNSASPAASDVLGYVQFAGRSSTGVQREFGGLRMLATAVTNAAESGSFDFITSQAGAAGIRARFQAGVQVGVPTGTDKGSGTVNVASGYYVNGVLISPPGSPVTKTADFTVADTEQYLINNKSGSTCTVTLPTASSFPGRVLKFKNSQAQTVVSASSNVVPRVTAAAGTAILASGSGNWCEMVSDGTNWVIMAGS